MVRFFHFGPGASLFGTLHLAPRLAAPSAAVVLCNPFGEEAIRAHRMYRVLATQLARQGYPTLRFDYSCSGDSLGASEAANLDAWIQDVTHAVEALRDKTAAKRIALMGLRLGASVAALAAERSPTLGQHLVLWDPVVDGVAYLTELAHAHRQHLESELSGAGRSEAPPSVPPREVLGHPLSAGFADAVQRVELSATLSVEGEPQALRRERGGRLRRSLRAWRGLDRVARVGPA